MVSDECQCAKCGRLHKSLGFGTPPASISKAAPPAREDAREAARQLRRTIGFFASVIKSGEPWTEICEQAYKHALDALSRQDAGES
jgi:hypothetical protein